MEPIEYILAVRRRWLLVLSMIVVGVGAGYLSAVMVVHTPTVSVFTATTVMATDTPAGGGTAPSLARLTLLLTTDPVPARVAERIHFSGDPATLAARVAVAPHANTETLDITASAAKADRAAEIANAFGAELANAADEQVAGRQRQELERATGVRDALKKDVDDLAARLSVVPAGQKDTDVQLLRQRQEATVKQYGFAEQRVTQLESAPPDTSGVSILVAARAKAGAGQRSVVPASKRSRVVIGGLVGLLAGLALALLLDRFRPRLRTRASAERAFGLPLLGELPAVSRRTTAQQLVVVHAPSSAEAEAYRMLRTALVQGGSREASVAGDADGDIDGDGDGDDAGAASGTLVASGRRSGQLRVLVVTAAGPVEGTTVTVANLAASFAETGSSVIVVGYDLRHPRIHEMFGMSVAPGISDLRLSGSPIQSVVRRTPVPGVSLLSAGSATVELGRASRGAGELIATASGMADVVIIDTPPLLVTDDASRLIRFADGVLVVARAEVTEPASATAAAALLDRLGAPTIGVAFITRSHRRARSRYFADRPPSRAEGSASLSQPASLRGAS